MEFLVQNTFNTTTQMTVTSGSATSSFLLDTDRRFQFTSSGLNNDLTTLSFTISFDSTTTIDRIGMLEMNWKDFDVYYNGATANTFTITNPTTTTSFTSNSATDMYLITTQVGVTSITFDILSTHTTDSEKAIGHLYVGSQSLDFERTPNSKSYIPFIDPKEFIHELSDGGVRRHLVQNKWASTIKFKYISESFRNNLRTIYENNNPNVFVPFGTGTSWDGILYESNWVGKFEFYKYSADANQSGFSGSIKLRET